MELAIRFIVMIPGIPVTLVCSLVQNYNTRRFAFQYQCPLFFNSLVQTLAVFILEDALSVQTDNASLVVCV